MSENGMHQLIQNNPKAFLDKLIETEGNNISYRIMIEKLKAENKLLEDCRELYADKKNWIHELYYGSPSNIIRDSDTEWDTNGLIGGKKARDTGEALKLIRGNV